MPFIASKPASARSTGFIFPALIALSAVVLIGSGSVFAQENSTSKVAENVVYPASFFIEYQPITALDMVNQVPGFRLDNGDSSRGFGGAAGNVLINGERPGSKQDRVSEILSRTPAERVARIELIRGQTGALDARGQAVVANVILLETSQRAWVWQASVEQDLDSGGPTPGASISMVDRIGQTQIAAGIGYSSFYGGNSADEQVFDANGLIEMRDEIDRSRGQELALNLNTSTAINDSELQFNLEISYEPEDFLERSSRQPIDPGLEPFLIRQSNDTDEIDYEFGSNYRWPINPQLQAQALFLVTGETNARDSELRSISNSSDVLLQRAERERDQLEAIGRFELDYSGWQNHTLEFEFETVYNRLDNELKLFADDGSGSQLVPVDVPGANTLVEEFRADVLISDSWRLDQWTIETGLGAEASRIEQSGQSANSQDFFFIKPSLTLTYAPAANQQSRFTFAREVGQLNFGDFVTSANFEDDELDLGNPELSPQNTWRGELSHERRFGEIGVITLNAFHSWIRDVQDLLPIGGIFEVPGNIGSGRRWGVGLESTLPLDLIGIPNGRLDLELDWQDSSVTDPVTGLSRELSNVRNVILRGEFRQDFTEQQWAWGVDSLYADDFNQFGLDEIENEDQGVDIDLFIETTRFWGVKMRLSAQNLLDREFIRDRQLFDGPRGPEADLLLRELRDRRRGRALIFSISGNF